MSSLENWQEASINNPLFVIEDVKWLKHSEESFGDMIVRLFENDTTDAAFQHELYNDLIETFFGEIKKIISENYATAESKVSINYDDLASQLLTELHKLSTK
jgi:hypothetical protein